MKRNIVVLAFGTFDILHPGHVSYLTQARSLGDRLVVVIARDETVRKLKGRNPIFSEKDRLQLVENLRMGDEAVLGDKIHHCRIIDKIRPDIICLGYDQDITKQKLTEQLLRMDIPIERIIRAKKYKSSHYKSSLIKQRISV